MNEQALSREITKYEVEQALKELDVYGYASFKNFLKPCAIEKLLLLTERAYDQINSKEKIVYKGTPERDRYDKILYNLQNIDKIYIDLLCLPGVSDVAKAKLNDPYYRFLPDEVPNYTLQYYNARSSGRKLDLHIDSIIPFPGEYTNMMQFGYLLQDSNEENGCTVVVPGSHKSGKYTDRDLANVRLLSGKAGDLVFWDSRLWHGTLENSSGKSRWMIIATLGMWWVKPSMDIVKGMNDEIYKSCSDQQKQLLGFCAIPPVDPMDRNNTKCGYDFLKPSVHDYDL
jgi:ectoine hydroxylase-related dioxygenase (phytanoyl-CoA dioxygenase family)